MTIEELEKLAFSSLRDHGWDVLVRFAMASEGRDSLPNVPKIEGKES